MYVVLSLIKRQLICSIFDTSSLHAVVYGFSSNSDAVN